MSEVQELSQVLYRMGGRIRMAATEASLSAVMGPAPIQRETTMSDGYPIVQVSTDAAADAAWWASRCACDIAIRSPAVKLYEAPASVRSGYVDLEMRSVVFVRAGMGLSETRSTIAHEVAHLAGADEREARRYEADRRRGAWWATRRKPAETTAEEWAMHASELRGRRYRVASGGGDRCDLFSRRRLP